MDDARSTVPREPLDGIEKVHAKYGHLREDKRRRAAEQRARAEAAESD